MSPIRGFGKGAFSPGQIPDNKLSASMDTRDATFELDRLSKGLDGKTRARMASRLEQLFQQTQRDVHVLSGALRASGRRKIDDGAHHWKGTITYGGRTSVRRFRQKRRPYYVDYAAIENALVGGKRGGSHEFFRMTDFDRAMDDIEQIVADWLSQRDRRNIKRREKYAAEKGDLNTRRRARYAGTSDSANERRRAKYTQNKDAVNARRRAKYAEKKRKPPQGGE